MISGFDVYRMYLAMKCHYTQNKFNYYEYNKKTRANISTYRNRNDKSFFEKLAKDDDVEEKLIFILSRHPETWIGDILQNQTNFQSSYQKFLIHFNSLTYNTQEELKRLSTVCSKFDDLLFTQGDLPVIINLYLNDKVSLETLTILVHMTNCHKQWNVILKDHILWNVYKYRIIKHHSFVKEKYQIGKIKQTLLEYFI